MTSLPKLGEGELSSPDFTLAAKAVSADELEPERSQSLEIDQTSFTRGRAKTTAARSLTH